MLCWSRKLRVKNKSLLTHFSLYKQQTIHYINIMSKPTKSVRIEVETKDQATLLNYALGVVHRELSSNMETVADDKLDDFMDNVKWTRKHATSLNEKFSLTPEV